jgi:hypothetical protein
VTVSASQTYRTQLTSDRSILEENFVSQFPCTMSAKTLTDSDRYSLVSSLYGPGTTVCWFLTVLSCIVRWTLHPKKRKSGSVDSDFIAVITFSAVAAGHLIVQVHSYPGPKDQITKTKDLLLLRRIAAIEASLNITETFMAISAVLFLVAISFKCVKRGVLSCRCWTFLLFCGSLLADLVSGVRPYN